MQLIVDSFGAALRQHNGLVEVRYANGTRKTLLPQDISSILIARGVALTSDVLLLAAQHNIDVIFTDRFGKPQARLWNNRFGSIATIRKKQVLFAINTQGIAWAKQVLLQKINNQIAWLYQVRYSGLMPTQQETFADDSINTISKIANKMENANVQNSDVWRTALRGWEGIAAMLYFKVLNAALPPNYRFESRTRPATDRFNAMLNYLYGILYARVESALIHAGIDPFVGVFHADEYNKPVLTYDCIEPYRIWADVTAFRFAIGQYANHRCFEQQQHKGAMWLSTEGKRIIVPQFNSYLAEVVPYNNLSRSRQVHIQLDAHELAQKILKTNF